MDKKTLSALQIAGIVLQVRNKGAKPHTACTLIPDGISALSSGQVKPS